MQRILIRNYNQVLVFQVSGSRILGPSSQDLILEYTVQNPWCILLEISKPRHKPGAIMTKEFMKALKLIKAQLGLEQSLHEPTLISGAKLCV